MRIVLASHQYPPDSFSGGIATQTQLKARGLAALGHEVHVIAHSRDGRRRQYVEDGVTVVRLGEFDPRFCTYTEPAQWLTHSAQVAAEIHALNDDASVDLVDFPEWGAEAFVHLLNQTESRRITTAVHLHGPLIMLAHTIGWPDVDSDFYRVGTHMEGTCLRLADLVYSSSACSADWCADSYALDRGAIDVLHMGVDLDRFRPLRSPKESRPTVVFVGRLSRKKGAETLVRAAIHVARSYPDLQVRLLGRDDDTTAERLRAEAARVGFPNLITAAGFTAAANLPNELCRAHVFAAPSVYEGGPGLVYLEAMACGLPVIACSGSGAEEVVHHGETGLLVDPGDEKELAEALLRLLADEKMRAAMGARARVFAVEHADTERQIQKLEALYESVVGALAR